METLVITIAGLITFLAGALARHVWYRALPDSLKRKMAVKTANAAR